MMIMNVVQGFGMKRGVVAAALKLTQEYKDGRREGG